MKLPGRDRAFVPERKLTAYLLSLSHPVGRAKARFFHRFGFDASNTDLLRDELLALALARHADVARTEHTAYGTKYVVDGSLSTPSGDEVVVRTVWMIEKSEPDARRFVTAYPA
ncbi:hypothetical protein CRI94_02325 [Longibacter salinarum]|uniref:DUF6883 domain-containing protein n=1 Tax=Longibacter salinarum TaxID=1850348 RepID=A0A2A8D2G3_9BACT|nr:DUF6883 domain-containing protein [Longibacter salinarum]PEN15142.1 hypothetical protein CRI94_02325 [Longibacter salinarum]